MPSRNTPIKQLTASFIANTDKPFTAQELINFLHDQGQQINKTTAYRQLEALVANGDLQELVFVDGIVRYERKHYSCHHHLICNDCGKIEHIELGNVLVKLQTELAKQTNFEINNHELEFYGRCAGCAEQPVIDFD